MAGTVARHHLGQFGSLLKESLRAWYDDYAPSMGAAIAFYTAFSLAPLLLVAIAIAGLAFGEEAARGEIVAQLQGLIGDDGAKAVQEMLAESSRPASGTLASAIGLATLLIGATSVFGELQAAMDRIWRSPAVLQQQNWWQLVHTRILSFGMIVAMGFLLLVSLIASAAISALGRWGQSVLPQWGAILQVINLCVGFAMTTLLFALAYRILPRARIAWSDVWIGAVFTAALFTLGKYLIGLYIARASVSSGFGAAGSLVVVLVWVYYSAQIFLLGAEFTWVFAHRSGSRAGIAPPPPVALIPDAQTTAPRDPAAEPAR